MALETLLSTIMDVMFPPSFATMILMFVLMLFVITQVLLVSFSSCDCARSTQCTCSLAATYKNQLCLAEKKCQMPASFANVQVLDGLAFETFRQVGNVLHKPLEILSTFKDKWQLGLFSLYQPRDAISLQPFGKNMFVLPPPVSQCHSLSEASIPSRPAMPQPFNGIFRLVSVVPTNGQLVIQDLQV